MNDVVFLLWYDVVFLVEYAYGSFQHSFPFFQLWAQFSFNDIWLVVRRLSGVACFTLAWENFLQSMKNVPKTIKKSTTHKNTVVLGRGYVECSTLDLRCGQTGARTVQRVAVICSLTVSEKAR